MNRLDKQYTDLLATILEHGVDKKDRTGTGTRSIFGYTIRHNMKDGFPLLTTKKMSFKTIVTELIWFLRGDTNIKFLVDNNCHIWDGDAYKAFGKWKQETDAKIRKENPTIDFQPLEYESQEEFINKIKTDDEFAKKWGELGPIYGAQWRSWGEHLPQDPQYKLAARTYIDQIHNSIDLLIIDPDSRRNRVSAWNVGELNMMVLPPCHTDFQFYSVEMTNEERCQYFASSLNKNISFTKNLTNKKLDELGCPSRRLSLMWNQRSVDTFLGLPFNIASYGLLLEIIGRCVNMIPDQLIGNLGDVHLYSNHIQQAKEQIGRKYTHEERTSMLISAMGEEKYNKALGELMPFGGGMSEYYDSYNIPHRTREPFDLPKLILNPIFLADLEHKGFDAAINGEINFKIENYQAHPHIPAPLSN
jgi:thymidylate synthase